MYGYTEDALVEQPAIELFREVLGWESADLFGETFGENGTEGRRSEREVVLVRRLRVALRRLNPDVPEAGLEQAIEQLTEERGLMSAVAANREVYELLKEGATVTVNVDDEEQPARVRFVDWDTPENNDFFLASQFWIKGEYGRKRTDLLGFVNGIPLVFIELKAPREPVEDAYRHNLSDYKTTIPQLFAYNAFIILSNGRESRVGTLTSQWGHFAEWKKVGDETEPGVVSLETMLLGTCEKGRLLDLVENFTLFSDEPGGAVKILAKNHQYLGVNNALRAVQNIKENEGRLGVFWHTQGSGKSYSMVFFSQKILRKVPGNWTFLVVTDRVELDDQIHGTFQRAGAVTKENVQAASGADLRGLLTQDNRYVFSLIQKFRTERGETYPTLTERGDIIVMTDEAHRSQYDIFARNMRHALPNAAFIGFTGTPLMAGEERTREVFGDYVSVYNFRDAIEDNATVPLYYENRIPELQLVNEDFNRDMEDLLEDAMLDEAQEGKLEREFAREYHLITRDDRLEKVAQDLVEHYMGRGHFGKAMMVSVDKPTAVRMYDKVQKHWRRYLTELTAKLPNATPEEKEHLAARIAYMQRVDMAVVVSQAQNEIEDFQKKGLDIATHRKRMTEEDLDERFKDPADTLQIVFLCAMWLTGFDAPSVSTLYLDKPMKNHTLMQTIARANRVWGEKNNGLIVDYIGVFRNLQKALAIYGTGKGGEATGDEMPIKPKDELLAELELAVAEATEFLGDLGVKTEPILSSQGFKRTALLEDAYEAVLVNDETKQHFAALARKVDRLYKATLPTGLADAFAPIRALIVTLQLMIEKHALKPNIATVMTNVDALLDASVAAESYIIRQPTETDEHLIDLGRVDFEALKARFNTGRKRSLTERLRGEVNAKAKRLARLNKERLDYLEKLQRLIDDYNEGSHNLEAFFDELVTMAQDLNEEEQRHAREELSEEELAVFDLLVKPNVELTDKERKEVKAVARELVDKLKWEKLVLDWRKSQQTKAGVRVTIEETLDKLPERYEKEVWEQTCDVVYQHIYSAYKGAGQSVYAS